MALRTTRQMVEVLSTGDGGKTRVTRQSAAVLAAGIGKLRVHRQMIEVLAGELAAEVYEASASSAFADDDPACQLDAGYGGQCSIHNDFGST